MNQNDFVSVDHLLSEITITVGDEDFKKGIPKGKYISWIQKALQELALDTFYMKRTYDVEFPENCRLPMPSDMFNIREVYVYNGKICNPAKSQVVHWKRLFNNSESGDGYTARVKDDGSNINDLFIPNQSSDYDFLFDGNVRGIKYYWNQINGVIMFSRECKSFGFVRIVANTMGGEIGDVPDVPRFFEQAVIDFVKVRFYNVMKGRDPRNFRTLWSDAKNDLEDLVNGSWNKAKKRVKSMDSAQKESINEYISSRIHK